MNKYRFPLAIQLTLPNLFRENKEFRTQLKTLQKHGFAGVELNIVRPEAVDTEGLRRYLLEHGLSMTMFATGAAAIDQELSLSTSEPKIRHRSIEMCRYFVDFASEMQAGIIIGFLQGTGSADRQVARRLFTDSLQELAEHAEQKSTHLLIEACNRYITSVTNSLDDAYELAQGFPQDTVRILADTFHMNIEERDMLSAIRTHANWFDSIHFSDNNRLLPGLGAIDFSLVVQTLSEINFSGIIALEADIRDNFFDELALSMSYLSPILSR